MPRRDRERLPHGRHRLSVEEVAANQRRRLIGSTAEELAERGVSGLSARRIAAGASVSSYTFYENFENVEEALIASFAAAAQSLSDALASACGSEPVPQRRIAVALAAGRSLLDQQPPLNRAVGAQLEAALPRVSEARQSWIEGLARSLGSARGSSKRGDRERVAAALALILGDGGGRPELAGELAGLLAA